MNTKDRLEQQAEETRLRLIKEAQLEEEWRSFAALHDLEFTTPGYGRNPCVDDGNLCVRSMLGGISSSIYVREDVSRNWIVEDFAFLEWRKTQNPYDPLLLSFNEMGTDIKQLSHGVAAGNWPTANDPSESVFSILPPVHQVFGREKIMYIWLPTCERLEPVWSVLKKLSETPEWKI